MFSRSGFEEGAEMIFRSPYPDVEIPEVSLDEYCFVHASDMDDKVAIVDGVSGVSLTYGALGLSVERLAKGLSLRGFKKGDVFAIYLPNCPEYAVAFFGVGLIGGINTTVNPLYTAGELQFQLRDAGAIYLLTMPELLDRAIEGAKGTAVKEIFVVGEAEGATPFSSLLDNDGEPPEVQIHPKEDLIVLPYSSGTTGLPKGVELTHYNLVANLCQLTLGDPTTKDDTLIGVLPFYHIYGMVVIMANAIAAGARIVTMARFDLQQFLRIVQEYRVTRAHLVPPIVLALAKHPLVDQFDLSSLRTILSGAAPLGADVQQACADRLPTCLLRQGYGLTEASPVTHITPEDRSKNKPGSIGPLIAITEGRLVDYETGRDVDAGEPGELLVRGPQIMRGYLNNPDATRDMIDGDGWMHTGDIAVADADGYFTIVDRAKELIKYNGYQVPPAELEAILLTHPAVADAAVIPSPDPEAGEIPKGYVVKRSEVSGDELIEFVAARISPQKRLRQVEFIDAIPKSASGKILRRVLVEQERAARS
jgi:acyl-CoA synthetase (AMP-forming)/AMP-acid ligase II